MNNDQNKENQEIKQKEVDRKQVDNSSGIFNVQEDKEPPERILGKNGKVRLRDRNRFTRYVWYHPFKALGLFWFGIFLIYLFAVMVKGCSLLNEDKNNNSNNTQLVESNSVKSRFIPESDSFKWSDYSLKKYDSNLLGNAGLIFTLDRNNGNYDGRIQISMDSNYYNFYLSVNWNPLNSAYLTYTYTGAAFDVLHSSNKYIFSDKDSDSVTLANVRNYGNVVFINYSYRLTDLEYPSNIQHSNNVSSSVFSEDFNTDIVYFIFTFNVDCYCSFSGGTNLYFPNFAMIFNETRYYYSDGFNDGYSQGKSDGYNDGYSEGERVGYINGKADGSDFQVDLNNTFLAVFDAPFSFLYRMLNFEIWGINFWYVLTALISILLILFVIRLIL